MRSGGSSPSTSRSTRPIPQVIRGGPRISWRGSWSVKASRSRRYESAPGKAIVYGRPEGHGLARPRARRSCSSTTWTSCRPESHAVEDRPLHPDDPRATISGAAGPWT